MKRACSLNTNKDEMKRSGNPQSEYFTGESNQIIEKQIIY